jgi:hypothetical protein
LTSILFRDSESVSTTPQNAPHSVQRRAKLFEAGEYPDKGVTVTPDHLKRLAETFSAPVPVLIEHAASPLEIGHLTAIECVDAELFGTITLTAEADALVQRSGARSLSLGLAPDLSAIREVSLVRNPRVASARLFGGEVRFVASLDPSLDREWRQLREARVEREVEDLLRSGRLTPAQRQFAQTLLASDDTIEFDGESRPVGDLVRSLIERQPRLNLSVEVAPAPISNIPHLHPEEADFYRRHFPDLPLEEIASRK